MQLGDRVSEMAFMCDRTGLVVRILKGTLPTLAFQSDSISLYMLFPPTEHDKLDRFIAQVIDSAVLIDWEFISTIGADSTRHYLSGSWCNSHLYVVIRPSKTAESTTNESTITYDSDFLRGLKQASRAPTGTDNQFYLSELAEMNNHLVSSHRELVRSKAEIERILVEERKHSQRVWAFYQAALRIVGASGTESICQTVITAITEASGYQVLATVVYLRGPNGKLTPIGKPCNCTRCKQKDIIEKLDVEALSKVIGDEAKLISTGTGKPKQITDLMQENQISTAVLLPLLANRRRIGCIVVFFDANETVDPDGGRMLEAFAAMAATAIDADRMRIEMEELAMTDSLTGLLNRRAFIARCMTEAKRSERRSKPLSIIIIDLDEFKQVNDTFGHQTGDRVLATLAKVIQEDMRAEDLLCRYGGEEFAMALPETNINGALVRCERLRALIENTKIFIDGYAIPMTASIGVAELESGLSLDQAMIQADTALYEAKRKGRNQVRGWQIDGMLPRSLPMALVTSEKGIPTS